MSTDERDHLEFRGKDIKECEQFIAAVNKYARAEGKSRDDQWIADFVAVCLAEDGLIWWSLLDEETQGSWRLLRQAMISAFRPLFYGKSGVEAEDFVLQIRRRALHMGKLNDPRWTAEFASACFARSALRWYASLDHSVRGDWDSLQQAIFCRYSQGFGEDSSAPTIPSPAFAATAPIPNEHWPRGRIRVCKENDPGIYYLSKMVATGEKGRIIMTSVIAEALEVEYEPTPVSNGPQMLTIPDNQIPGCNQLGMKWHLADTTLSPNHLVPCAVDSSPGAESPCPSRRGPLLTIAWEVFSSENEQGVKSVFGMSGPGKRLLTAINAQKSVWIWFKPTRDNGVVEAKLVFEPVWRGP